MKNQDETLSLPTAREMRDAVSAFEDGDLVMVVETMTKRYRWLADKAIDRFDREKFIAGATAHGYTVTEYMIQGAHSLSKQIGSGFRRDARETAEFLARLHRLIMDEKTAKEWDEKAKLHAD